MHDKILEAKGGADSGVVKSSQKWVAPDGSVIAFGKLQELMPTRPIVFPGLPFAFASHFAPAAHDHGMPMTAAASLLALIGIFNVAGTVASGWLTDRGDARRLLAAYFALRGLALLALPLLLTATVQPPLVAFVVVFGLLDVATVPPTIALSRAYFGADAAIVFGWINSAHQVGAGAVAFLGGAARDAFGSYDLVWVGTAALCATAALLSLASPGRREPSPAAGRGRP